MNKQERLNGQLKEAYCLVRLWALVLLGAVLPNLTYAEQTEQNGSINFVIGTDTASEFQLEVREQPLARVLDELAKRTDIPIHYSVLPEGYITATCVGASLKSVLECVLNKKADVIVRYGSADKPSDQPTKLAEVWVLGAKLEAAGASKNCTPPVESKSTVAQTQTLDQPQDEIKMIQKLLADAKSKDPVARADAFGALLGVGHPNDPKIKAILEEGIHDQNPNVRAQALSSLARREDEEAAVDILQEALHDDTVEVRLMAVDSINNNVALLQQAANDSDSTVRQLALAKLEQLQKKPSNSSE